MPTHNGPRAAIESFAQYTDVLDTLLTRAASVPLPSPWHLVGQSTGGAIAMDYCLRHCAETVSRVDKVVLLAPLVRPHQWWRGSLLHSVLKHVVEGIPRSFVENSHDAEFLRFLREDDPLQSRQLSARWVSALKEWLTRFEAAPACAKALFVVQGTGDTTVDWRYNLQAIALRFPHAHIETISEARHHLVNESQPYRDQLYELLDRVFQY
jgi:alpha-beta hydrolase superfamily lysophospholipase